MKNKILYAEVIKAAEDLATALRKYSSKSIYCSMSVLSRDENVLTKETETAGENTSTDFYMVRVHESSKDEPVGEIFISESAHIDRAGDGRIEGTTIISTGR